MKNLAVTLLATASFTLIGCAWADAGQLVHLCSGTDGVLIEQGASTPPNYLPPDVGAYQGDQEWELDSQYGELTVHCQVNGRLQDPITFLVQPTKCARRGGDVFCNGQTK